MKRFFPLLSLLYPIPAFAVASAVTGTPIDGLVAMVVSFLTGPLTLLMLLGGLFWLCFKIYKGHDWGSGAVRYVSVATILAGGMQLIVRLFGGNLVVSVLC
jgi:hypothetical protein